MCNLHEEFEYENLCHLNLLAENYIMHPKHIYWMFQDLHVVQCILLDILLKKKIVLRNTPSNQKRALKYNNWFCTVA